MSPTLMDLHRRVQQVVDERDAEAYTQEPSTNSKIEIMNLSGNLSHIVRTHNKINAMPTPETYGDLAKIVKLRSAIKPPPKLEPTMHPLEYTAKKVYSQIVEKPLWATGEFAGRALATASKFVGLPSGVADYFNRSADMWKAPPVTEELQPHIDWLRQQAYEQGDFQGMVFDMTESTEQILSYLIQRGVLGPMAGLGKAAQLGIPKGVGRLPDIAKSMGFIFGHGMATTPGDMTERFTAAVTRMGYNMTPFIANWTGATGWSARTVDMALNAFLTSPYYIEAVKTSKNPAEFFVKSIPQFMTDFVFALSTTGEPMNIRLKAMGQRPSYFGRDMAQKEDFLETVDRVLEETQDPYGMIEREPIKQEIVRDAKNRVAFARANAQAEREELAGRIRGWKNLSVEDIVQQNPDIQLTKDISIKDLKGEKHTIKSGEAYTPYELKGNKVLLQDGNTYVVTKNQYQNISGHSIRAEAKEFAPELKDTEETILSHEKFEDLTDLAMKKATEGLTPEEQARVDASPGLREVSPRYDTQVEPGDSTNYREIIVQARGTDMEYFDPHFDKRNTLFHIRVNERTDAQGNKVLFVEEVQSDWNLAVRRGDPVDTDPRLNKWTEMAVKRALKEAVASGAKYVSWTTGEQQAARYDLSKRIESVKWRATDVKGLDTAHTIILNTKERDAVFPYTLGLDKDYKVTENSSKYFVDIGAVGKDISQVVGKGLADKIKAASTGKLEGVDLKIGGEWAYNLYDKQVPNIIKDLTGKDVETVKMETGEQQALKITPEVRAKVLGEIPPIAPTSGQLPLEGRVPKSMALQVPQKPGKPKYTAGEHMGEMLTKTEAKKRLAQAKKEAHDNKIRMLLEPILGGRKLTESNIRRVSEESKNFWDTLEKGWAVLHLRNIRMERLAGELDGYRAGPNTELFHTNIHNAQMSTIRMEKDDVASVQNIFKEVGMGVPEINKFYTQRVRWGRDMELTPSELVETHLATYDKAAVNHLTKPVSENGMGFTKEQLAEINNIVDTNPVFKRLAEWKLAHYDKNYNMIADVYKQETGKVLPRVAYYVPLRVLKEYIDFEKDNYAEDYFNRFHTEGYLDRGMVEARKSGATQPLKLDFIDNFLYDMRRRNHYVNFALPLKEMRSVMNDPKWRNTVEKTKGKEFYNNVKKYYGAVAGTRPSGADDTLNKALSFFRTNAGTAMLGFNILTAMRQPLSMFQAMAEVGPAHVLSGVKQLLADPKGIEDFVISRSDMVKFRQGQFERFMGERPVGALELFGQKRLPKELSGQRGLRELAMALPIYMDKNTVIASWKAAYDRVMMTGKTIEGEQIRALKDMERIAILEADRVIRRTQPMAAVHDLPSWHRDSNWAKMFTMFQNQVNQNYNYFAYDIIGRTKAGKITPLEAAQKTLFAYLLPALALGMISRGGVPQTSEQVLQDLAEYPLSGMFFFGNLARGWIREYDSYSVPPLQFAIDLQRAGAAKTWATATQHGIKGLALASGIPHSQFNRTYKGLNALLEGDTADWRRLIWSQYALEQGLKKKVPYRGLVQPTTVVR